MSYCRWSDQCDVYAYKSVGGWVVHVIDGGHFHYPTPQKCADHLECLRSEGFHVPQYAIDNLRKEGQ